MDLTGTGVMKGFDFDGNERWARDVQDDYGLFGQLYGYGSSPLLFENSIYVQVLHGSHTAEPSYLLRLDKITGQTLWRVGRTSNARQESPDAYTTPTHRCATARAPRSSSPAPMSSPVTIPRPARKSGAPKD